MQKMDNAAILDSDDEVSVVDTFVDPLASLGQPSRTQAASPTLNAVQINNNDDLFVLNSSDDEDPLPSSVDVEPSKVSNDEKDEEDMLERIPIESLVQVELNNSDNEKDEEDDDLVEITSPSPNVNSNQTNNPPPKRRKSPPPTQPLSKRAHIAEHVARYNIQQARDELVKYQAKRAEVFTKTGRFYDDLMKNSRTANMPISVPVQKPATKKARRKRKQELKKTRVAKIAPKFDVVQLTAQQKRDLEKDKNLSIKWNSLTPQQKLEQRWSFERENLERNHLLLKRRSNEIAQKLINSRVTSTELRQSGEEKTVKKITPDGKIHEFSIKLFDSEDDFINYNLRLNCALFMS